jgi:hypothetical protein
LFGHVLLHRLRAYLTSRRIITQRAQSVYMSIGTE